MFFTRRWRPGGDGFPAPPGLFLSALCPRPQARTLKLLEQGQIRGFGGVRFGKSSDLTDPAGKDPVLVRKFAPVEGRRCLPATSRSGCWTPTQTRRAAASRSADKGRSVGAGPVRRVADVDTAARPMSGRTLNCGTDPRPQARPRAGGWARTARGQWAAARYRTASK